MKHNAHFLLIVSLGLSLAVLWYVDWRLPAVHLGPLAALPLFLMAYRIGLWPTIPLAFAAAIALALADYDVGVTSWSSITDLGIDSTMLLIAFGIVAIAADRMRERELQVATLRRSVVLEQHRAEHDPLTRLGNRAHFEKLLNRAAQGAGQSALSAILVADIDGFKAINDQFGHRAGDYVLREVARCLRARVRASDTLARIGGDEFGIVLHDIASAEDARKVSSELRLALAVPIVFGANSVSVSISVGYSLFPNDGTNFHTLVDIADRRMYEAKAAQRAQREAVARFEEGTLR